MSSSHVSIFHSAEHDAIIWLYLIAVLSVVPQPAPAWFLEVCRVSPDGWHSAGQTNLKITFFRLQVGRASDVWSLGCILYQMVYGHTPFSALAFIQKMHAITDDKHRIAFPPVRNAALADTIRRCLDRNPRTRITMQVSTFCSTASGEGLHLHIVHVTPFAGCIHVSEGCRGTAVAASGTAWS